MYAMPILQNLKETHNKTIKHGRSKLFEIHCSIKSLKNIQEAARSITNTCDNISENYSTGETDNNNKQERLVDLWYKLDIIIHNNQKNREYYFSDMLNILSEHIQSHHIKFKKCLEYTNLYLTNKLVICTCGCYMIYTDLGELDIPVNHSIICDFSRNKITISSLQCQNRKNINHPFGFDIDAKYSKEYMTDFINRRLEVKLHNAVLVTPKNNPQYDTLQYKHKKLCLKLIDKSITYYKGFRSDLNQLSVLTPFKPSYIIKLKHKIRTLKRILRHKNNWLKHCKKCLLETKTIYENYIRFNISLEPFTGIYKTHSEKSKHIASLKIKNKTFFDLFEFHIESMELYNMISYDIDRVDLFDQATYIINIINIYVYKVYESIETLDNCTPTDEIIPFNEMTPSECISEMCTICQTQFTLEDEFIVNPNKCNHYFHKDCFMSWITRSNTCPLCR